MSAADTIRVVCQHSDKRGGFRRDDAGRWQVWAARTFQWRPDSGVYERYTLRCDRCRVAVVIADVGKIEGQLEAWFRSTPEAYRVDASTVDMPLAALAEVHRRTVP